MTLTDEQMEDLRRRASIVSGMLQMGEPVSFGSDSGMIDELLSALEAEKKRADEAEALAERLKREAVQHAQEARTANATIAEIYQAVTGGAGEPGNWRGAEPIKAELTRLREALIEIERLYWIEGKDVFWRVIKMRATASAALTHLQTHEGHPS